MSPSRQDRVATLAPLLSVLLFLAAIIAAFWYLRNEEIEREVESVKRDAVAWATREAILAGGPTFQAGPVAITVSFRLPMPRSRRRVDRDRGWRWADKRPDLDKLQRSTLDGLTAGGVFGDDCQVVRVTAEKIEVLEWTGASITISEAWGPA